MKRVLGFVDNKNSWVHIAFLIVLSSFILFWDLGQGTLVGDETVYAEITKEILKTGDWITLHINYSPVFNKPPLWFWLTAIAYKIFGINEFSVRFWSALFGMGAVLTTYLLGKELFNKRVGFISAIILLLTPQFNNYWGYINSHSARTGTLDVPVTFFIALSILFFWLGRRNDKYLILAGIAVGLGVMTKSVMGLLPVFIILPYTIFTRELKIFRSKNLYKGVLAFLAVAAPWHILEFVIHGKEFFDLYFTVNVIERAAAGVIAGGHEFFYIEVIKYGFYPWSIFVLFAFLYCAKTAYENKNKGDILLLCWIGVVLGIFTYSQNRELQHIIPLYPALSICVARLFNGFIEGKKDGLILSSMFITFALWASFVSKIKYAPEGKWMRFAFDINDVSLIQGFAISAIVFLVYAKIKKPGNYDKFKTGISMLIVGIILASAIHLPPVSNFTHDVAEMSLVMKEISNPDAPLIMYNLPHPGGSASKHTRYYAPAMFYSDRRVWLPSKKNEFLRRLNSPSTFFSMTTLSGYKKIQNRTYQVLANSGNLILFVNKKTISPPPHVYFEKIVGDSLFYTINNSIYIKEFELRKSRNSTALQFAPEQIVYSFEDEKIINEFSTVNVTVINGSATLSKYEPSGLLVSKPIIAKYFINSVTPKWNADLENNTNITIEISVDNGTTWTVAENGDNIKYAFNHSYKYLLFRAFFQTHEFNQTPILNNFTLIYEEQARAGGEIIDGINLTKYELKRGEGVKISYAVKNTGNFVLEGYSTIDSKNQLFTKNIKTRYAIEPGETASFEQTFTIRQGVPGRYKIWIAMWEENLKIWVAFTNVERRGFEEIEVI